MLAAPERLETAELVVHALPERFDLIAAKFDVVIANTGAAWAEQHAALLERTKERAAEIGAVPSVLSFDVHPDTLVFGKSVPLINSAIGREDIIRRLFGIDNVVFLHFNRSMMQMDWVVFIESLIRELNIGWIVVGHDFCFGSRNTARATASAAISSRRSCWTDRSSARPISGS